MYAAAKRGEGAATDGEVRLIPGTVALASILIPIGSVAIGTCRERAQQALREHKSMATIILDGGAPVDAGSDGAATGHVLVVVGTPTRCSV